MGQMQSILGPLISTYEKQQQLQQPAIQFAQGLASGDPSKVTQAAGPQLAQISQQFAGAKQNILDTTPKGAGQDFALMQLPEQQANATAGLLGGEVNQGMNTLLGLGQGAQAAEGNIASGLGGLSMQQLGAGLTAGGQASQTNQSVMQAQAQQKATMMSFIGQLAGAAGGAATGGLSSILGGGGGSVGAGNYNLGSQYNPGAMSGVNLGMGAGTPIASAPYMGPAY